MLPILKKMALGLVLIVASAAILLYSDIDSRHLQAHGKSRVARVAIVQQISIPALDDGISGALAALKDRGYVDGGRMILRQYNAQGDISTGNAIAREVTSGDVDLIFSFSTVSLQTIANANRFATPPRKHVFALVSDPYAVGVGISRENHLLHPPYMTGVGSLAPVEDAFKLAREMLPVAEARRPGLGPVGSQFRGDNRAGAQGLRVDGHHAGGSRRGKLHRHWRRHGLVASARRGGHLDQPRPDRHRTAWN